MKVVFLGATIAASVFLAASCGQIDNQSKLNDDTVVVAPRVKTSQVAHFDYVQLDDTIPASNQNPAGLAINYRHQTVLLQIITCPKGAECIWSGPSYPAEIVSQTTDNCNVRTVVANKDRREIDGTLTEVIVKDFAQDTCEPGTHPYLVEATLTTKSLVRTIEKERDTFSEFKSKNGFVEPAQN